MVELKYEKDNSSVCVFIVELRESSFRPVPVSLYDHQTPSTQDVVKNGG